MSAKSCSGTLTVLPLTSLSLASSSCTTTLSPLWKAMREPPDGNAEIATTFKLTSSSFASTVTPRSTSVIRTRGLAQSLELSDDVVVVLEFEAADGAAAAEASVPDGGVSVVVEAAVAADESVAVKSVVAEESGVAGASVVVWSTGVSVASVVCCSVPSALASTPGELGFKLSKENEDAGEMPGASVIVDVEGAKVLYLQVAASATSPLVASRAAAVPNSKRYGRIVERWQIEEWEAT
ncbi:hypothetical protein PC118_g7931 [Phytophthora cactorum]|uniref:Secreted protein n=1 Tax=Phytophthora cactorum TaxID=29920 RepID=A0A8T1FZU5_9STRA|nr:hypothetical protein PC118_g7931 [Phytophthora cactorum]